MLHPLRATAVGNAWANILVIGVLDGKLVVEVMVESEQPCPDIDLIVVVRVSAESVREHSAVLKDRLAIKSWDVRNHCSCQRTPQRIAGWNDVRRDQDREPVAVEALSMRTGFATVSVTLAWLQD